MVFLTIFVYLFIGIAYTIIINTILYNKHFSKIQNCLQVLFYPIFIFILLFSYLILTFINKDKKKKIYNHE